MRRKAVMSEGTLGYPWIDRQRKTMRYYYTAGGKLSESVSLWDALRLFPESQKVVSLVGAGGKTSLMFGLANEAARKGMRVIVTTSTQIFCPRDYPVLISHEGRAREADSMPWDSNILVVGMRSGEDKLKGLPREEIGKLRDYADLLLIEADGSRRLPLKLPATHEPVIIPETDAVIACAGLDCIGHPFEEVCFRYELAEQQLSVKPGTLVNAGHVAEILCSREGSRKTVEGKEFRVVLNKADAAKQKDIFQLAALLEARGELCAVTQLKEQ